MRIFIALIFLWSCTNNELEIKDLSIAQRNLLEQIPTHIVIAHRGTTFYAPEETEAAMIWARNIGAHYLEFDLQRTKDGYLVALHDNNLERTSNVKEIFPERAKATISQFTYRELLQLNFGKWFNDLYPQRAQKIYEWQDILTLEDIIQIAEGNKISKDKNGHKKTVVNELGKIETVYEPDPSDSKNRPGIYIETKVPEQFPEIEKDLKKELQRLKWFGDLKTIEVYENKINIANTNMRLILQTFSKESLTLLNQTFGDKVPLCFLLWQGNESTDDLPNNNPETFVKWLNYGIENGATIIGPSIAGAPNNYPNLLTKKNQVLLIQSNLHIHPYSFDTKEQISTYGKGVQGLFSNKSDEALKYWK